MTRKNKFITRNYIILIIILFTIASGNCACKKKESPGLVTDTPPDTLRSYLNPVGGITDIGDPYVLKYNNNYYMYATSSSEGFYVWKSSNLVDWEKGGLALNRNNTGNNWGKGNFWAPEVKYYKGKFYMTYSAISDNDKMKIRIAKSDNPTGPFLNWSEPFLAGDQNSYIDADLFIDGDKTYLYFVKDCSENIIDGKHVSQVYVCELSPDLMTMTGYPQLILSPDQAWEGAGGDWQWNEGPFVMKHDNLYYLLYSANYYASAQYSVGVATSSSPTGTWTKYTNNPVLKQDAALRVSGPGHCMVTISPDSTEYFIVYHTHTYYDNPSGNRNMCIDRLYFDNSVLKVKGPTRTPQPLPGGIPYRIVK